MNGVLAFHEVLNHAVLHIQNYVEREIYLRFGGTVSSVAEQDNCFQK